MYNAYDDIYDISHISDKVVTARVVHLCNCGMAILPGEKYLRRFYVDYGLTPYASGTPVVELGCRNCYDARWFECVIL